MEKSSQIKCPNCGEPINVNDVLAHQVREEYLEKYNVSVKKLNEKNTEELKKKEQEFREQLSKQEGDFKLREQSITEKEKALANARADMEKQIIERLASEKEKQALSIKATVYEEFEMQLKSLGEENEERKVKLKQLHETAALPAGCGQRHALSLFHGEGRCGQNLHLLRLRAAAHGGWQTRPAGEHGPGFQSG